MGGWKGINQTPVAPFDFTPSPTRPAPQLKAHIYSSMYNQQHTPHNIQEGSFLEIHINSSKYTSKALNLHLLCICTHTHTHKSTHPHTLPTR